VRRMPLRHVLHAKAARERLAQIGRRSWGDGLSFFGRNVCLGSERIAVSDELSIA
jgi:hypothetical protein